MRITGDGLDISDIDSELMQSATVVIINRKNGAKEILAANTSGTNIEASFSSANGALTLEGADTIANYEKVMRTVTYRIDPDVTNPDPAVRSIQFNVYDGTRHHRAQGGGTRNAALGVL